MKRGFTLVELLLVVGLVVGVTGVGVAGFRTISRRQAVDAATEKLRQAFLTAKASALSGKKDCATATCLCNDADLADDRRLDGWNVAVNPAARTFTLNGHCDGVVFAAGGAQNLPGTVGVSVAPAATTGVTFRALGRGIWPSPTLAPAATEIVYTIQDNTISYTRTVTVTREGEVR